MTTFILEDFDPPMTRQACAKHTLDVKERIACGEAIRVADIQDPDRSCDYCKCAYCGEPQGDRFCSQFCDDEFHFVSKEIEDELDKAGF